MTNKEDEICWYHGKISRDNAETLLEGLAIDGAFLVRESNSSSGDFVLSVLYNKVVHHYQIRRHTEDAFFSIDEKTKIHGLDSLIEHYQEYPEGLNVEGLTLTEPCKGEEPPHDARRHGRSNLLHRATSQGNYKVVSEILKSSYKHDAKNQDGQTAVHIASVKGKDDILLKLINKGVSVNSRDTAGYTPLHYACQNNHPSTVRLLVQIGKANIQARSTENEHVPLHEAAINGHRDVVKELLSLNAPVNPRTKSKLLPSELARRNRHFECAEMLENYQTPSSKTNASMWYHGTLDRQEAEILIRNFSNENGTFLVRFSDRNSGATVLTLLNEDLFFNYIIRKQGEYLFIDDGPLLDSLEHIVDYYSFISDGLPTVLKTPVPPKPKPPVPEFSTMPRPKRKILSTSRSIQELPKSIAPSFSSDLNHLPSQLSNITFSTNITSMCVTNNNYVTDSNDKSEEYISTEKLKLGKVIGEGEFGSVLKGTYLKNDTERIDVAIKTLRNEHIDTNRDAFLSEAQVMMKLDHHCIVKLIGLSLGPPLLMVQELVKLGSLLSYLVQNKERIKSNYEFKIWAAQIACGMTYLEEQRFVHRDLAARNILLASQHQAKISDFGLSRALGTDHEYYRAMQGGKWPLKWYAPESFNYGTFSHASDVWSFGVTLWEMYTYGKQPYGDRKGSEVIAAVENGERLLQPPDCPSHIYDTMLLCWAYESEKRPTFSELLETFSSDNEYINIRELIPEVNLS